MSGSSGGTSTRTNYSEGIVFNATFIKRCVVDAGKLALEVLALQADDAQRQEVEQQIPHIDDFFDCLVGEDDACNDYFHTLEAGEENHLLNLYMIYELVQTAMKQQLETMHTASDGEQKTLIETYLRKVNLSLDEINGKKRALVSLLQESVKKN